MALLLAFAAGAAVAVASPIENVVVLMLENRAFDHMLGHLKSQNAAVDGLTPGGDFCNPVDPTDPSNTKMVCVNYDAIDGGPDDPCHSFDCITQQVYGFNKSMNDKTSPVKMDGFVANAEALKANVPFVMSAHNATDLPVLSALAMEYALFDHWHVSCPCPTNPNREFLMSGTANGKVDNAFPPGGFTQQSHFLFLEQRNVSWSIYYHDDPWMAPTFADLRTPSSLARVLEMPNFYAQVANGTLPQYSLIQPRMATSATGPSNWQHPDGSVAQGEVLTAAIYDALRGSAYWEKTLFIITYDEHGGFYDHQPNPTGVPPPDNVPGENGFDYSRLGVRVATVAVSPWIKKGTLVQRPLGAQAPAANSEWDATSIISTANKIFGITESMTARDAWAGSFTDILTGVDGRARTDCPLALPAAREYTVREQAVEMERLLNDHHLDSINLLCEIERTQAHAACARFASTPAREAERSALLSALQARAGEASEAADDVWPLAEGYAHLDAAVARRLRQRDFEAISRKLFSLIREQASSPA